MNQKGQINESVQPIFHRGLAMGLMILASFAIFQSAAVLSSPTSALALSQAEGTSAPAQHSTDVTTTATATPTPLPGLVAYWSFDNCDATDDSGNGYDGRIYGDPACVAGVKHQSFRLDGVDDWISLEDHPPESFGFDDFSISVWFRTQYDERQHLIQSTDGSTWGLTGYSIKIRNLGDIEAGYRAAYPHKCEMHTHQTLNPSSWHHIVMVRNTDQGKGFLYLDGSLVADCEDPDPTLSVVPQSYLRIGYGIYIPGNYEKYFDGALDQIRIFDRALSASEVQALYAELEPPTPTPTATATPTPTPPCLDAYEPDDIWYQAKLLTLDDIWQHHGFHQPGDVDYVKFVALSGQSITLRTRVGSGVDTTLTLYDTDGITQLVYNDDDPFNPPASRIDWIAPATGTYFLKAANLDPGVGGCDLTYELAGQVIEPTPTPTPIHVWLPLVMKSP